MKKKIRYSDFADAAGSAAAALPEGDVASSPILTPAATVAPRHAPLDLARALGEARAREAAALKAPVPALPTPASSSGGRLTPVRGTHVAGRPTPRATSAVPRPAPMRGVARLDRVTPLRGSLAISPSPAIATPLDADRDLSSLRARARARAGSVDVLMFRVGNERFGVELVAVEEAIDLAAIRHIPEMPPAMLGVITVRGSLAPIYSPAHALNVSLTSPSSALIFRRSSGRLGLAVDEVDDVHTLDLAQLRDSPGADALDGILLGVLRHDDALLALVDADALIVGCQAVPALEIA